jgi:hypothetical protein
LTTILIGMAVYRGSQNCFFKLVKKFELESNTFTCYMP